MLAPWYRLVEDGDRLLLEHGRSVVVLEGRAVRALLPALLPLLDGTRTVDEVVASLGETARPAVELALGLLDGNGLLAEGPAPQSGAPPSASALAALYGLAPSAAVERLRLASVAVVGDSETAAAIARLLQAAGLGAVVRGGWEGSSEVALAVVAPSPGEAAEVLRWNRLALERSIRWLAVRPFDGLVATIGPLVIPGESACYECLLYRLAAHVEYGSDLMRIESSPTAAGNLAPLHAIVAGVAAQLTLGFVAGFDTRLPGALHVLELRPVLSLASHPVLRVPRCPACSSVEHLAPPLPWHEAESEAG